MKTSWALYIAVVMSLLASFPSYSAADTADYIYDDAGRLLRVIKGTEAVSYVYDAVGNLLSIKKGSLTTSPPVLHTIDPNALFIGSTTLVSIKGQNLLSTTEVASANPLINIRTLDITDTAIVAEMRVAADAIPGNETITVKTLVGQAGIPVSLTDSKLSFGPGLLVLAPGSMDTVTATLFPPLGRDVIIQLRSSNSSVASAPQSLLIPSSGTASFLVQAIKEGFANINAGAVQTTVIVSLFTPEPGDIITSKAGPVSITIEPPAATFLTVPAFPMSVYIDLSKSVPSTVFSYPASILIQTPSGSTATTATLPLSIRIASESIPDAIVAALPVSLLIEPLAAEGCEQTSPVSVFIETPASSSSVTSTLPVSIYVEPPNGNTTVTSLPVSTKKSP